MDQITNKVKSQLFAKGIDNMNQLQDIFLVSKLFQIGAQKRHRRPLDYPFVSNYGLLKGL